MSHQATAARPGFLLTSCLLAGLPVAPAQQFASPMLPRFADGAIQAALDLDGDGDDELITTDPTTDAARVFVNLGRLRFAPGQALTVTNQMPGLHVAATGDIDNDGDPDLLLGTGNGVLWFPTNGGQLGAAVAVVPTAAGVVRCLDVDGDADLDLAIASVGQFQIWLNGGNGAFTQLPLAMPLQFGLGNFAMADLDRDGVLDVVMPTLSGQRLWMRRGAALVDETQSRGLPPTSLATLGALAADLDGDGDADVLLCGFGGALLNRLFVNDGLGRFSEVQNRLASAANEALAQRPAAADFDSDGDLDLLLGAFLLQNDGTGAFTVAERSLHGLGVVCDLDDDNRPDLCGGSSVARVLANGRTMRHADVTAIVAGDLDTDGDADILDTNYEVWTTEGSEQQRVAATTVFPPRASSFHDFDGDGDLDALVQMGTNTQVLRNNGTGTLTQVQSWNFFESYDHARAADIDNDGDLDLVLAGLLPPNTLRLFENRGNLTFVDRTAAQLPPNAPSCSSLAVGDADGDGDLDLLLGTAVSPPLAAGLLLRNVGAGVMVPDPTALAARLGTGNLAFAQFDRDPELEIVGAIDSVAVLFDRVGATWIDASSRLNGAIATGFTVIDFDADGDHDLIAHGAGALLANDGNGTFTEVTGTRGPGPVTAAQAVDLDGDGDLDLIGDDRLWINEQRQLTLTTIPRPGNTIGIEFVAERGFGTGAAYALLTLGLTRTPRGIPLLGGRILPDPATSVLANTMFSTGGQPASLAIAVPANPVLTGLVVQMQGLVIGTRGELALANHLVATIE